MLIYMSFSQMWQHSSGEHRVLLISVIWFRIFFLVHVTRISWYAFSVCKFSSYFAFYFLKQSLIYTAILRSCCYFIFLCFWTIYGMWLLSSFNSSESAVEEEERFNSLEHTNSVLLQLLFRHTWCCFYFYLLRV